MVGLPKGPESSYHIQFDLPFPKLAAAIAGSEFSELSVRIPQTRGLRDFPRHHRDPFDRLLVTQALEEGISLVSADPATRAYPAITSNAPTRRSR